MDQDEFAIRDDDAPEGEAPATAAPEVPEPTRAELIEALESISLLAGLLPRHLERMADLARVQRLKKGEYIFAHGDAGDGLYVILAGKVRISRNLSGMGEEALAVLGEGKYFGEMSIVDDEMPRSADAIAHESGTMIVKLPKDDLRDLMFVDRELAYELLWRFVRTLSGRVRESNDRLLMLTMSSKF